MTYTKYLIIILLLLPTFAFAGDNIILPWLEDFDDGYDYSNNIWVQGDCGAGSGASHTHRTTSEYCWSGGCADFSGPTDECAGPDGGISAYGFVNWPTQATSTTTLNVRFLMRIGSTYVDDIVNGGQHENKVVNIVENSDGGTRQGLITLHKTTAGGGGDTVYGAIGIWTPGDVIAFNYGTGWEDSDQWIQGAAFRIDVDGDNARTDIDICVELQTTVNGTQYLKITEQDGTVTSFSQPAMETSGHFGGLYLGGYYNATMPTERQSNHLIYDEFTIARQMTLNTFIGPPIGFFDSDEDPALSIRGVSISP